MTIATLEKTLTYHDRKKIKTAVYNWRDSWREKAKDIFMFVRYAKEDFDSDDWERKDRKSTRLNSSHVATSRMPSSA